MMKVSIEVHETAKRKPTSKDAVCGRVMTYNRVDRCYRLYAPIFVTEYPSEYPLWYSLRGLPKPPPDT